MTTMKKIFSMIALMLMAATGAMAQTYNVTHKDRDDDLWHRWLDRSYRRR